MKTEFHYERLIDDILLDEDLLVWRGEVLKRCYVSLQWRRLRYYSLAGLLGIAAILLLIFVMNHRTEPTQIRVKDAPYLVRSTPLTEQQIVRTGEVQDIVKTQSMAGSLVATVYCPDLMVTEQTRIARLSNTDMLGEFKGAPCGIIHSPEGLTRFVFFRPEDRQRFFYGH